MFKLSSIAALILMSSSVGANELVPVSTETKCNQVRGTLSRTVLIAIETAKASASHAEAQRSKVVAAMFEFNDSINAEANLEQRRLLGACVNEGVLADVVTALSALTDDERANLRALTDALRSDGAFVENSLASKRAARKAFIGRTRDAFYTLLMAPTVITLMVAVAAEDFSAARLIIAGGAAGAAITLKILMDRNNDHQILHEEAIGFIPRHCGAILAGFPVPDVPNVRPPAPLSLLDHVVRH